MSLLQSLGLEGSHLVSLVGAGGKTSLMFALAGEYAQAGGRVLISTTTKIASDEAAGPWPAFAAGDAKAILSRGREALGDAPGAVIAYSGEIGDGLRLTGFAPEVFEEILADGFFDHIVIEADGSARKPLKAPAGHEPVVPCLSDAFIMVTGLGGLGRPLEQANLFRPEIWAELTGQELGAPVSVEALACMAVAEGGFRKGCPSEARRILFLNQADTPEREDQAKQAAALIEAAPEGRPHCLAYGCMQPAPEITGMTGFP